jgi:hypothetical protein
MSGPARGPIVVPRMVRWSMRCSPGPSQRGWTWTRRWRSCTWCGRSTDEPHVEDGRAVVMHIKEHLPLFHRTPESDADPNDAYVASCTCGEWEHSRRVNPDNPLDRAEVEDAWFEHTNPGVRL